MPRDVDVAHRLAPGHEGGKRLRGVRLDRLADVSAAPAAAERRQHARREDAPVLARQELVRGLEACAGTAGSRSAAPGRRGRACSARRAGRRGRGSGRAAPGSSPGRSSRRTGTRKPRGRRPGSPRSAAGTRRGTAARRGSRARPASRRPAKAGGPGARPRPGRPSRSCGRAARAGPRSRRRRSCGRAAAGPRACPPNWFRRKSGFWSGSKKFRASSASLRWYSYTLPCQSF